MAGTIKLDGATFLEKDGGNYKITNTELKLKSSGNTIVDSSGNALVSESSGKVTLQGVTLGDTAVPNTPMMFRNKLINGNFDIWQRGTSQTIGGYGSADRWRPGGGTSTLVVSQQSFDVAQTEVPGNPKYYLRQVVTSSTGGNSYLQQRIESVNTLAGKTATLSFWAKADSNKNIAIEVTHNFGTGGSPSTSITGTGVTTHSLTTSWQKFTTTVSIPHMTDTGLAGGTPLTIGTDGNDFVSIMFWFDAGSSLDSRTNSLGNQSGTFDIAQVQLEEGSAATPFEQRPIGMELGLCQRYYQQLEPSIYSGTSNGTTQVASVGVPLSVSMRATPTGGSGSIPCWHSSANVISTTTTPVFTYTVGRASVKATINGYTGLTDNKVAVVYLGTGANVLDAEL